MGIEDRPAGRFIAPRRRQRVTSMSANDWLAELDSAEEFSTFEEDDNPRGKEARRELPRALLLSELGSDGLNFIASRKGFCLVVEAPSPDWVAPVYKLIAEIGGWNYHVSKSQLTRNSKSQDDATKDQVVRALGVGGRIFGVSQSPKQMLPDAMVNAADMTVKLPRPSSKVIAATIKAVTSRAARGVPADIGAGLTFDEIAACIRQKSTPKECVDRLERATKSKRRVEVMGVEVPEIKDLHGYGEAKNWALNLIDDMQAWRRGEIELSDIDRNVVLASDPGLGKTSFVRSLARSTNLPLVATSVGAWFANSPGYLDSIIKQIDEVFAAARAVGPAILFLDELDGLPNRATISPRGADWWMPVIGHVLTVLDGATSASSSNLIVIGATNHPTKIDSAVMRPGRMNRFLYIANPDTEALKGIFRQHLGADLPDADLGEAARLAAGYTGAFVVGWVKAARRAARTAKRPMTMADLLTAIAPEDDRPLVLLRRVAIHECGHAVVANAVKMGQVRSLSILAKNEKGGVTVVDYERHATTREALERIVLYHLGGRAAESVLLGDVGAGSGGADNSDLANATHLMGLIHMGVGLGDQLSYRGDFDQVAKLLPLNPGIAVKVEADLQRLYAQAQEICRREIKALEALSGELLDRRFLDGADFVRIVEASQNRPAKPRVADHG